MDTLLRPVQLIRLAMVQFDFLKISFERLCMFYDDSKLIAHSCGDFELQLLMFKTR